jgi:two-component system OmpR family response regulator
MRILVVEDDKNLNRQISDALAEAGYVVDSAYDGEEGHFLGDTEPYDAVAKPFHIEEVLARVRALIRRAAGHATTELVCGGLRLDTKTSKVDLDGAPVKLTSHEFRLLAYLMHHMGEVVSRTELVEHLYDQDFDRDSNTVEVFVGRLRKKIGNDLIETVRGMGYRMHGAAE